MWIFKKSVSKFRAIAKTPFDSHTDLIFQNLGILKFYVTCIYLIQLGLYSMYPYQKVKFIHIIQETLAHLVCLSVVLESNN